LAVRTTATRPPGPVRRATPRPLAVSTVSRPRRRSSVTVIRARLRRPRASLAALSRSVTRTSTPGEAA
jgi:hypothetical protein